MFLLILPLIPIFPTAEAATSPSPLNINNWQTTTVTESPQTVSVNLALFQIPYSISSSTCPLGYPYYLYGTGIEMLPCAEYTNDNISFGVGSYSLPNINVVVSRSYITSYGGLIAVGFGTNIPSNLPIIQNNKPAKMPSWVEGVVVAYGYGYLILYINSVNVTHWYVGNPGSSFTIGFNVVGNSGSYTIYVYWNNGTLYTYTYTFSGTIHYNGLAYVIAAANAGPGYGYSEQIINGIVALQKPAITFPYPLSLYVGYANLIPLQVSLLGINLNTVTSLSASISTNISVGYNAYVNGSHVPFINVIYANGQAQGTLSMSFSVSCPTGVSFTNSFSFTTTVYIYQTPLFLYGYSVPSGAVLPLGYNLEYLSIVIPTGAPTYTQTGTKYNWYGIVIDSVTTSLIIYWNNQEVYQNSSAGNVTFRYTFPQPGTYFVRADYYYTYNGAEYFAQAISFVEYVISRPSNYTILVNGPSTAVPLGSAQKFVVRVAESTTSASLPPTNYTSSPILFASPEYGAVTLAYKGTVSNPSKVALEFLFSNGVYYFWMNGTLGSASTYLHFNINITKGVTMYIQNVSNSMVIGVNEEPIYSNLISNYWNLTYYLGVHYSQLEGIAIYVVPGNWASMSINETGFYYITSGAPNQNIVVTTGPTLNNLNQLTSAYTNASGYAVFVIPINYYPQTIVNFYWYGVQNKYVVVNVQNATTTSTPPNTSTSTMSYNYSKPFNNTISPNSSLYNFNNYQPWAFIIGIIVVAVVVLLGWKFGGVGGASGGTVMGLIVSAYMGLIPWWIFYIVIFGIALYLAKIISDKFMGGDIGD
ncbi:MULTISPECIES: hypothetical protein [unclassified Brevundimonas]|uniref:hypothetical protein n=1 Tax=unclassified Brevundimonas TaxID=2622653 RepID=UPI003B589C16